MASLYIPLSLCRFAEDSCRNLPSKTFRPKPRAILTSLISIPPIHSEIPIMERDILSWPKIFHIIFRPAVPSLPPQLHLPAAIEERFESSLNRNPSFFPIFTCLALRHYHQLIFSSYQTHNMDLPLSRALLSQIVAQLELQSVPHDFFLTASTSDPEAELYISQPSSAETSANIPPDSIVQDTINQETPVSQALSNTRGSPDIQESPTAQTHQVVLHEAAITASIDLQVTKVFGWSSGFEDIPIIRSTAPPPTAPRQHLIAFPVFPRFPLEIRRKIWAHSFPEPRRMIPVLVSGAVVSPLRDPYPGSHLNVFFTLAYGSLAMKHPMSTSVTKIHTQLACREARDEYLFNNPKFLITNSGGKIRYHPDETVIFIINWNNMGSIADKITEHLLAGLPVDNWVSEIKRLGVRKSMLRNDMRHVTLMTGIQQLIHVEEPPRKGWLVNKADYRGFLNAQKKVLEETAARIAPDFKIPRFSFLEQDAIGERWWYDV